MSDAASWRSRAMLMTDPESYREDAMEFRLTYEGPLLGASRSSTRSEHKHAIRTYFHWQLKRLWDTHPILRHKYNDGPDIKHELRRDELKQRFCMGDNKFVPLITDDLCLTCHLDILFLRPDPPGNLLSSGDIDNRLKTLFDALRLPKVGEFSGDLADDLNPLYCLLEDDGIISQISVETDMMLQSVNGNYDRNAARLIISVTAKPYIMTWNNADF
ncbi:hypothetical protein [Tistlia consotensis]|uniref:hypothetical protein n=1 Tax=Tistlia consotensis TaxID=1321365 RepID=UPI00117E563C|nr:hypothetical protein [Tistlia consotensis]